MSNTFIQIHTLTGYNSVLLNRDDTGMAKRIEYGSSVRVRTSSQFAKRKLRLAEGEASVASLGDVSVRSRLTFRRLIAEPLVAEGLAEDIVVPATLSVMDKLIGVSDTALAKRSKKAAKTGAEGSLDAMAVLERDELVVLGRAEIDYLRGLVRDLAQGSETPKDVTDRLAGMMRESDLKRNLREIGSCNKSLDIAMFGRMVTGDALSSMDAAVHVAHAISVHGQGAEIDFFTAVDDLKDVGDDHGSAHMGQVEITSPLLYGYYVIDFGQLLDNLRGLDNAREVAARLVGNFIRLAASGVVGAKKGSTAPYSTSDFVLVEVGTGANRTLAEAFRKPVAPTVEAAVDALAKYVAAKDAMYGNGGWTRFVASIVEGGPEGIATSVPGIAAHVESILGA